MKNKYLFKADSLSSLGKTKTYRELSQGGIIFIVWNWLESIDRLRGMVRGASHSTIIGELFSRFYHFSHTTTKYDKQTTNQIKWTISIYGERNLTLIFLAFMMLRLLSIVSVLLILLQLQTSSILDADYWMVWVCKAFYLVKTFCDRWHHFMSLYPTFWTSFGWKEIFKLQGVSHERCIARNITHLTIKRNKNKKSRIRYKDLW